MSKQVVAEAYAFVLDSCFPRNNRAVRLELLEDGTLVMGDWSDECDLFDSGSEIRLTPANTAVLSALLSERGKSEAVATAGPSTSRAEAVAEATPDSGSGSVSAVGGEGE